MYQELLLLKTYVIAVYCPSSTVTSRRQKLLGVVIDLFISCASSKNPGHIENTLISKGIFIRKFLRVQTVCTAMYTSVLIVMVSKKYFPYHHKQPVIGMYLLAAAS